ncbi:hypothetical protein JOY44_23200 [Phormidium sp. CLA17]|uniref:hypothetical protein n=1 Tax=Leptolyngbya sp. Cla-17 TaxID=2803751 RepID=UPI001490A940|nr:hypothetical protein [Leptolyngbya sp. Cla-17]MBM0744479.1 hypothetical protein [Leptolyngbya sp. Cla-17]
MQYAILIYETEPAFTNRTDEANQATYWGAYQGLNSAEQSPTPLTLLLNRRAIPKFW